MKVELMELLNHYDPDLTVYEIKDGDKETRVTITVADWKETLLAINGCARRINDLYQEFLRAEARIEKLEHRLALLDGSEEERTH